LIDGQRPEEIMIWIMTLCIG